MTEAEWLACDDPGDLYNHLGEQVSPRKLRLFACACTRHISHLFFDDRCWKVVEIGEKFADSMVGETERAEAHRGINAVSASTFSDGGCGRRVLSAGRSGWFPTINLAWHPPATSAPHS